MYNVEKVLPFLEKAPLLRNIKRGVDRTEILTLPEWVNVSTHKAQYPYPLRGYLVQPLGFVVVAHPVDVVMRILREQSGPYYMELKEVDYRVVAETLEVETKPDGKKVALYPSTLADVYEEQDINYSDLIDKATLGEKLVVVPAGAVDYFPEEKRPVAEPVSLREEISLDAFGSSVLSVDAEEESAMVIRLRSYFEGGYTTNRVPLLVGQSAVGKSALIKSLAAEYGYRMIDVRTAFMSRLDIEGLTQKIDIEGQLESFNCPMSDFVEATDAYIDYCAKAAKIIEEHLNKATDDETIKNLSYALEKFKEGAKIPVLLFDEVTRGEGSVRQALTKILTDKEFMGYSMKKARVIAATNAIIDDSSLPEDLFLTKEIDDVAFFDRFESIPVGVSDAYPGWVKWAKASSSKHPGSNIHPDILNYCTQKNKAYDLSPMVQAYDTTGDINEVTTTVYPNFRTWEKVSDYLYSLSKKEVSASLLEGLIGKEATVGLMEHLLMMGYKEEVKTKDFLTDAVEHGMDSNIPTLLISPSSMGKTSRIKKAVEDRGYTFIQVNLGQQDRLDLSGPPVKVDINRLILDRKVSVSEDVRDELLAEMEHFNLPKLVTVRAPKSDLAKKFRDARATGRKVVLFYDELNRVQNPSVMSSVFEAISDHRAFGIDFDPDSVTIFAACNLGDNMGDASQLDPAIANRFAVYWKKSYTKEDADSFIEYAKSSGMSKELIGWLEGMTTERLLDVISSIDSRTIEMSAASTRGIEDLDKFIKDKKNNSIMSGTVIFGDGESMSVLQKWTSRRSIDTLQGVMDVIHNSISNWSALRGKETYKIGGQSFTAKELSELFDKTYKEVQTDSSKLMSNKMAIENLVSTIAKIDSGIKTKRAQCVGLFLGINAPDFSSYYNQVSGRDIEEVGVEDIIDINMVDKYVAFIFRGYPKISDADKAGVRVVEEVYAHFKNSLPKANCRLLIESIVNRLPSADSILNFLRGVSSDIGGKDVILEVAEGGDESWAKSILNKVGIREVARTGSDKPRVLR